MSDAQQPGTARPAIGSIAWRDLTAHDAEALRDFYARVVGWQATPVEMAGYSDYVMTDPDPDPCRSVSSVLSVADSCETDPLAS